jgi:cytochrome c biogenesis protein
VHRHDDASVSSERGHLKETGNLVFHLALILVIIGVGVGHLFGWKGDVIVPVGQGFANTLSRYDTFSPGPWVDPADLAPFAVEVDRLDATFEERVTGRGQFGQPRDFTAHVRATDDPGAKPREETIKVNHPLEMDGASVFLLGNGYAPVVTVRDGKGDVVYREATPFLAQDNNYKSVGAIKVSGATPQLGFFGLFLPTAVINEETGPSSVFPDARKPALALGLYEGELFPEGRPQSVYTLDTQKLTQITNAKGTDALRIWLEPGQTFELPGGRGSITFEGLERFAGLSVRSDPGKELTLVASLLALAGLVASLVVRRRRVFVRVSPGAEPGRTVVSVGGMAKDDDDTLAEAVGEILDAVERRMGTR